MHYINNLKLQLIILLYTTINIIYIYIYIHIYMLCIYCVLVTQSCLTLCNPIDCSMSDFPVLLSPGVCSDSCPLSLSCHPTISSSVVPFSSCPQSFPASGSFLNCWLFVSSGPSISASVSASVLLMNIQVWFPLGLTGLISL